MARLGLKIAVWSLLIGALGAPIFHVAVAVIAPQGFANLRGDRALAIPIVFLVAWLWSAVATFAVGGVSWRLLHRSGLDGFVSYLVIALLAGAGASFAFSGAPPNWDVIGMVALNAFLVRLTEIGLRKRWAVRNSASGAER